LGAALDATERRAGDAPPGDQEARDDLEQLALARDPAQRRKPPRLARRLDRLAHDRDVAGRLEGVVGAEAVRLLADPADRILAGREARGGAVGARLREPCPGEVEREDPLGTCETRADHGSQPDEPTAEDGNSRALLDARRVEGCADPGREAAGKRGAAV